MRRYRFPLLLSSGPIFAASLYLVAPTFMAVPTACVVVAIWLVIVLWLIPTWQGERAQDKHGVPRKDLADLENKFRTTLAQAIAGLGLVGGLYFTSETLRVNQEGQVTERFTRAVEQLADGRLDVRLGGIYALERIARDSSRDHWPVMQVLAADLRQHATVPSDKPADVGAILAVLRERNYSREGHGWNDPGPGLDLSGIAVKDADLHGTALSRFKFRAADLQAAQFSGAEMIGTDLSLAKLNVSRFERAIMFQANLQDASLVSANMDGVMLLGADLRRANLDRAILTSAVLVGANFQRASLRGAKLVGSQLGNGRGKPFLHADLSGADVEMLGSWGSRPSVHEVRRTFHGACGDAFTKMPRGVPRLPACSPSP